MSDCVMSDPMARPDRAPPARGPSRRSVLACILVALGLVLGASWGIDRLARHLVEAQIEQQVSARVPGAQGVEVTLDGFPFTVDALARGRVDGVHVRIDAVRGAGMQAADLRLDARGLEFDVGALLDGGLVIHRVDTARVEGFIAAEQVAEVVGRRIQIEDGRVFESGPEGPVELEVGMQGSWIELYDPNADALPMVFPLPSMDAVPCQPQVRPAEGRLQVSCSVQMPQGIRT